MPQAKQRGKYACDWKAMAAAVKADAGGKCVRCGTASNYASGHVLTVHHFDGDRDNNARWNLMALCQRCHLSVQSRVDPEIPLLLDPAPWAMPFIAGFYASGRGTPGPTYDLARWKGLYETEIGLWPGWAP